MTCVEHTVRALCSEPRPLSPRPGRTGLALPTHSHRDYKRACLPSAPRAHRALWEWAIHAQSFSEKQESNARLVLGSALSRWGDNDEQDPDPPVRARGLGWETHVDAARTDGQHQGQRGRQGSAVALGTAGLDWRGLHVVRGSACSPAAPCSAPGTAPGDSMKSPRTSGKESLERGQRHRRERAELTRGAGAGVSVHGVQGSGALGELRLSATHTGTALPRVTVLGGRVRPQRSTSPRASEGT